ncbi:MAG TPA: hypothetical protein VJ853_06985, partial [Thermoanaerobaculia bacterium]|nr:hypothetical protein [Thermoanaerobaculia bacterium]
SVQLDPSYAPAWSALGTRWYNEYQYGNATVDRSQEATSRAAALDPDLDSAQRGIIVLKTERGDLTGAYRAARTLVTRRPESGEAHFSLSYVLRYAGLNDEAARECDKAHALDPTNPSFRSCAFVFLLIGDPRHGEQFANLDGESLWTRTYRGQALMHQNRLQEAAVALPDAPPGFRARDVVTAVLQHRPQGEIDRVSALAKASVLRVNDPEDSFFDAEVFAACGRTRDALDLLQTMAARNFCAYPALDHVPAFNAFRNTPEFWQIRNDAIQCQQRFLQWRAANTRP